LRGSKRIDDYLGGRPGERRRLPHSSQASSCSGVEERLRAVEERLASLEEAVRSLEEAVKGLARQLAAASRQTPGGARRGAPAAEGRRRGSPLEELLSQSRGVVMASEARQKLRMSVDRILDEAERLGAVTLDAGGDVAIMTQEAYQRFQRLLEEARTSDPEEAAEAMREFKRVFTALRRNGEVYYDARRGHWRLLRSPP